MLFFRYRMDVNGESMDRRWRKEIHVLELIIGAQWLLVAQFENRHVSSCFSQLFGAMRFFQRISAAYTELTKRISLIHYAI